MKSFIITRILKNEWGTFSVLALNEMPIGNILEPFVPIPANQYMAIYSWHPKHGKAYELQLVPGHSGILIHAGNTIRDTEGCLLPGKAIDKIWGGMRSPFTWTWGVVQSRVMLARFLELAGGDIIQIVIRENFYKPQSMGVVA
jgi:hypothetical protein